MHNFVDTTFLFLEIPQHTLYIINLAVKEILPVKRVHAKAWDHKLSLAFFLSVVYKVKSC